MCIVVRGLQLNLSGFNKERTAYRTGSIEMCGRNELECSSLLDINVSIKQRLRRNTSDERPHEIELLDNFRHAVAHNTMRPSPDCNVCAA